MYGSTESPPEAQMSQTAPKSVAQTAAPYVAEFVGTFAFVFTIGCCLLSPSDPSWNATAIGLILMVLVYATGPVSGGHLNPAVSLGLCLSGKLAWPVMLGYWVVQLAGGIASAFCFCALFAPRKARVEAVPPFTWEYGAMAELIYTALLCFVVLNCSASRRNNPREDTNQFYGLAIGFAMIAGGYSAGSISGALLNPAVAIGFGVSGSAVDTVQPSGLFWCWTAAELLGAAAAAVLFRYLRHEDFSFEEDVAGYEPGLATRCFSEFLGVFVLVLTVGLNVIMGSPAVPWSAAAALMCMVYALGGVSKGYFNPAVTLAVVLRSRCSLRDGMAYVAAQLTAGIAAGLTIGWFHAAGPWKDITYELGPGRGYGPACAGVAELAFTFLQAYVALACGTAATPASWRTKQNNYSGLAIGSCYTAGGVAVGAVSGGELNPAVCVGVAIASLCHHGAYVPPHAPLSNCLAFCTWELAGGLLAAAIFRKTHPGEFRKEPLLAK